MSIRTQAINGLKWTSFSTILVVLGQIVKVSVLARLLEKSDFGIIALMMFVLGFTGIIIDMGFTTAILHKQNITPREYSSLYWLNFGISIIVYSAIFLVSGEIAVYYSQPILESILKILALSLVISALGKQYRTIEQKRLNFRLLSIADLITTTVSVIIAIIFAIYGYGIYSIVYAALIEYALSNIFFLIYGIRLNGPPRYFTFKDTKPFVKIGLFQVGGDVINYLSRDIDLLIIGKVLGLEVLGGYNLARQLIRRPLQIIDPIINKVTIPIFPKYQNDNSKLRSTFGMLLLNVAIINAFIYGGMAIGAKSLIRIFYGEQYLDIASYLQLFAPMIYLRSVMSQNSLIAITKGRTDIGMYWSLVSIVLSTFLILLFIRIKLEYMIGSLVIYHLFLLVPSWYYFGKRLINFQFIEYINAIGIPLLISVLSFSIYYILFWNISVVGEILGIIVQVIFLSIYGLYYSKEVQTIFIKLKNMLV